MRTIIAALVGSLVLAASATALAQEETSGGYWGQRVDAPRNAAEITIGTGYTQPFGLVRQGVNLQDVATAGAGVEAGLGWRIDPRWMVGGTLQYNELTSQVAGASGVRGGSGTVDGTFHFLPYDRADPWVKLGTGYRMMWTVNDQHPNVLTHGFELARLSLGLDVRTSSGLAIAPVVGADLNVFVWEQAQGASTSNISDPRVSTFIYAGIQARMDVGATEAEPQTARRLMCVRSRSRRAPTFTTAERRPPGDR
jgi:hypothetical protein